MTTKLKTPPPEVSSYFEKKYPTKQGYKHHYYWYWAEETKKTKIYRCQVIANLREVTTIEAILEWYNKQ